MQPLHLLFAILQGLQHAFQPINYKEGLQHVVLPNQERAKKPSNLSAVYNSHRITSHQSPC